MDTKQKIRKEIYTRYDEIQNYIKGLHKIEKFKQQQKFFLLAQERTGSTLLGDLLKCHPSIYFGSEIFHNYKDFLFFKQPFFPFFYPFAKGANSNSLIYGFDCKFYQLEIIKPYVKNQFPYQLIDYLYDQKWKIIYLKRNNTLHQSISALYANHKKQWVYSESKPLIKEPIYINPQKLLNALNRNQRITHAEEQCLMNKKYFSLTYEDDLLNSTQHQKTVDKVFDYFELSSVPVSSQYRKMISNNLADDILNYEEIVDFVSQTQYAHFLDT